MNNIVEKYRQSRLTKEELQQLRMQVNLASDDEVATEMHAHWQEGIDVSGVQDKAIDAIRNNVHAHIAQTHAPTLQRRIWKRLQQASVILLPICLIALGYLGYRQYRTYNNTLVFSTGRGEQVSISLPDGTQAHMNESSKLSYQPNIFSDQHREIDFKGEAYFEVHHDQHHAFTIHGTDINVTVTGTKFHLSSYPESPTVTLCLLEGAVTICSAKTSEQIKVRPYELCSFDKASGRFKIEPISEEDTAYYTALHHREMVFHSTPLKQVIDRISAIYDIDIQLQNIDENDRFTGTLPTSDLTQCMIVLSKLYNCQVNTNEHGVTLTRSHADRRRQGQGNNG